MEQMDKIIANWSNDQKQKAILEFSNMATTLIESSDKEVITRQIANVEIAILQLKVIYGIPHNDVECIKRNILLKNIKK